MSVPQSVLLGEHFIAFKKDLYAEQPELLALFDTVSHEELFLLKVSHGLELSEVDFAGPGFTVRGMLYEKADISDSTNGWDLLNPNAPITSLEELSEVDVPGAYRINLQGEYFNKSVILVYELLPDQTTEDNLQSLIEDSFHYSLDNEVTLSSEGDYVEIPRTAAELVICGSIPIFEMGTVIEEDYEVERVHLGLLEIPGLP